MSLIVGKDYTYKQLCEEFGEKCVGGKSKMAQLQNWQLSYDLVKVEGTQKYHLNGVYDKPLDRDELRGRKSKYLDSISKVLLLMCYDGDQNEDDEEKFYSYTTSKSSLYVLLGLCKRAFLNQAYGNAKIASSLEAYPQLIQQFNDEVFGQLNNILDSVRRIMNAKKILGSEDNVEFAFYDKETRQRVWVPMGIEGKNKLRECQRRAMADLGFKIETQIYKNKKDLEYKQLTMKYMKELYDIEIVSYRSSITFYGSKDYINGFIEKNFDGNVEDIETFKKSLINTAMLDSNRSFTEWLDKRTEYDWFTLNNGYKSKKQMNNNMKVPLSDLYKWDDILIELYDGDVCEAHFHRDCANAEDKNDSYYNGEKKDLFE